MCLMAVADLEHMAILKIHKNHPIILQEIFLACINVDKYRNDTI